jgi:metallophosphoesterase superfamily enzyme
MRIVIIPDLHNHTENADRWLNSQRYYRAIFLGDFFDSFGDNVTDARLTAMWLRKRIESTDDVFLLGNHDAAYMFRHLDALYCPGFTKAKARAINEVLTLKHWHRFKLAHVEQDWLLSHAGFHPSWMETGTGNRIIDRCYEVMEKAARCVVDPLLGWGIDRGGNQPVGGPLWLDWDSLVPIPGINQIVGHTPGTDVREKHGKRSTNYCLDVRNGSVAAVLDQGRLTILQRQSHCGNRTHYIRNRCGSGVSRYRKS